MVWEIIAVVIFGIGVAGVLLFLRSARRYALPLWIIPAICGISMLGLQIFNEYTWFSHKTSQLTDDVRIIAAVEESVFWRPWSYIVPQVTKFIAVNLHDAGNTSSGQVANEVDLYLIERHMPARMFKASLNCDVSTPEGGSEDGNRLASRGVKSHDNQYILAGTKFSTNLGDLCL